MTKLNTYWIHRFEWEVWKIIFDTHDLWHYWTLIWNKEIFLCTLCRSHLEGWLQPLTLGSGNIWLIFVSYLFLSCMIFVKYFFALFAEIIWRVGCNGGTTLDSGNVETASTQLLRSHPRARAISFQHMISVFFALVFVWYLWNIYLLYHKKRSSEGYSKVTIKR